MAETTIHKASRSEFKECFNLIWERPYILNLTLTAGIGGILFGYDTGVISGALLYIRDEFQSVERSITMQETIVSVAIAGAIFGAAVGGWINDRFGRRPSILIADVLFFVGALIMGYAPSPNIIVLGRAFVGFGVGIVSMTSPLYISEASPAKIRGALVSLNALLITGGQFSAYILNVMLTKAPGTWRWMLGLSAVPSAIQFLLMLTLPESPRWLYRKGRTAEAENILTGIYPAEEVDLEIESMRQAIEDEIAEEGVLGGGTIEMIGKAWSSTIVRRALVAGILCQVAQQFVGINTVMYYSPTILQLAGYASNERALTLSLVTSGINTVGSIVSVFFVDRVGRRKMMLTSLVGIIACLGLLGGVFHKAAANAPEVGALETMYYSKYTCPDFRSLGPGVKWSCVDCLRASSNCGFCAAEGNELLPGACLIHHGVVQEACEAEQRLWYTQGCPSDIGWMALLGLGAYMVCYSPGMGGVPWIINSEIYPLRFRGVCSGMAAVANWVSNLIVSQTFLSLTKELGTSTTFLLFCGVACVAFVLIFLLVPETKGLQFEEVEKMLEGSHYRAWRKYESEVDCKRYAKT